MIIDLIVKLFTFVIDFIFGLMGDIIQLEMPVGLMNIIEIVIGYMYSGLAIVNVFCPISNIVTVFEFWIMIWALDHAYGMIMWILQKIPMLNIK